MQLSIGDEELFDGPGPRHSTPIKKTSPPFWQPGVNRKRSGLNAKSGLKLEDSSVHRQPPICKGAEGDDGGDGKYHTSLLTESFSSKLSVLDLEESTIVKQRQEIQLLVQELRERDSELTDLVDSHHQQLAQWEQDRQLILCLQHKCATLAELLQHRNEELAAVRGNVQCANNTGKINDPYLSSKAYQNKRESTQRALHHQTSEIFRSKESSLEKIRDVHARQKRGELENQNHMPSVMYLQHQYQTDREQSVKLRDLLKEQDMPVQEMKRQLEEAQKLIISLQQALADSGERERCKEEIIHSLQLQQRRMKQELVDMKNLYKRQNRELTLLQLSLDSSRDSFTGDVKENIQSHTSCMCKKDCQQLWCSFQTKKAQDFEGDRCRKECEVLCSTDVNTGHGQNRQTDHEGQREQCDLYAYCLASEEKKTDYCLSPKEKKPHESCVQLPQLQDLECLQDCHNREGGVPGCEMFDISLEENELQEPVVESFDNHSGWEQNPFVLSQSEYQSFQSNRQRSSGLYDHKRERTESEKCGGSKSIQQTAGEPGSKDTCFLSSHKSSRGSIWSPSPYMSGHKHLSSAKQTFDEKLIECLSSPQVEDASSEKTQVSSSPASKLQHLLLESQRMVWALEESTLSAVDHTNSAENP